MVEGYALACFIGYFVIPGFIVGMIVGLFRSKSLKAGILLGLLFAIVGAPVVFLIGMPVAMFVEKASVEYESAYFKSSLMGEHSDNQIKLHYRLRPLRYNHNNYIWLDGILGDSFKSKPLSNRIVLLSKTNGIENEVVEILAQLPNAPISVKQRIANSKDPKIVRKIAKSKDTPIEILDYIAANNTNYLVLFSVYLNRNCSRQSKQLILNKFPDIVNSLTLESEDRSSELMVDIAASPEATQQMHINLIKHDYNSSKVLYLIAKNPVTTPTVLGELAKTGYHDIKLLVAQNSKTPQTALVKLSNLNDSAFSDVANAAKLNLVARNWYCLEN